MNEIAVIADDHPRDRHDLTNRRVVDLQVNGYAGFDFNGKPLSQTELLQLCQRMRADGIGAILATVITAPVEEMVARVAAIRQGIEAEPSVAELILGIHVEGPFINSETGYVGAHPIESVLEADWDVCERMLDAAGELVRLWTLAPEMDSSGIVTSRLVSRGIHVAAGHTNASTDQLRRAIDAGISLFTHLGNGCPAVLPRHDNIIQRVLSLSDRISISFIADGHHIPFFALANYLKIVPPENVIVVSDCMSATGLGPGVYRLGDQEVFVNDDLAAWSADRMHFAGSATSLVMMRELLASQLGFASARIDQFTVENPQRYVCRHN